MFHRMPDLTPEGDRVALRRPPPAGQPLEGYPAAHRSEQERIVLTALAG